MAIYLGNTKVNPSGLSKVYVGTQKVWEKTSSTVTLNYTLKTLQNPASGSHPWNYCSITVNGNTYSSSKSGTSGTIQVNAGDVIVINGRNERSTYSQETMFSIYLNDTALQQTWVQDADMPPYSWTVPSGITSINFSNSITTLPAYLINITTA